MAHTLQENLPHNKIVTYQNSEQICCDVPVYLGTLRWSKALHRSWWKSLCSNSIPAAWHCIKVCSMSMDCRSACACLICRLGAHIKRTAGSQVCKGPGAHWMQQFMRSSSWGEKVSVLANGVS